MITFTTDNMEMPALDERKVTRWIRSVAADYGFTVGNINYIFCSFRSSLRASQQLIRYFNKTVR